jgi:hypothetical protein
MRYISLVYLVNDLLYKTKGEKAPYHANQTTTIPVLTFTDVLEDLVFFDFILVGTPPPFLLPIK